LFQKPATYREWAAGALFARSHELHEGRQLSPDRRKQDFTSTATTRQPWRSIEMKRYSRYIVPGAWGFRGHASLDQFGRQATGSRIPCVRLRLQCEI